VLAIEHFVWGQPGTAIQPLLAEHPEVARARRDEQRPDGARTGTLP
jgi:hypothetical protein